MAKIIYIMGTGHSGSTLLDITLGSHPDIFNASEIGNFWRHALSARSNEAICSCGEPLDRCPIWAGRVERWQALSGEPDLRAYRAFNDRFARLSNWSGIIRAGQTKSPDFERYARANRALFEMTQKASQRNAITDSSKSPARALALSVDPDIDLFVIHLVRDARAVAWSHLKRENRRRAQGRKASSFGVLGTVFEWLMINTAGNRLRARLPAGRSALIRYEAWIKDPLPIFEQLGQQMGLDLATPLAESLRARVITNRSHIFNGNHIRLNETLTLRLDTDWQTALSANQQRLAMAISGGMMRSFGYR